MSDYNRDEAQWLLNLEVHLATELGNPQPPLAAQLRAAMAEIERLESRQQDHLRLIAKITRETPYPAELDECRSARRALIAEVGTLRSERERLHAEVAAGDERLAGVLDGTFAVGDGTAQREIERLRGDVCTVIENFRQEQREHARTTLELRAARVELEAMRPVVMEAERVRDMRCATKTTLTRDDRAKFDAFNFVVDAYRARKP